MNQKIRYYNQKKQLIILKSYGKSLQNFLKDKFFSSNKYDDFINDLYNEDIFEENAVDAIRNNKDNFERQ